MNAALLNLLCTTPAQVELAEKHGTPVEFGVAVWSACPGDISVDEALTACEKYQKEWDAAGQPTKVTIVFKT